MKITGIRSAKRNQENAHVYLDNRYWITLSKNQILSLNLYKDKEISKDEKEKLESESAFNSAYSKALRFISYRPRSKKEIEDYFVKKNISKELCNKVLQKLEKLKLIDDEAFAKWYATGKKESYKLHGPKKVKANLIKKGISNRVIDKVFGELKMYTLSSKKEETLDNEIRSALKKKQGKDADLYKSRNKVIQKFLRKGFTYDQIKKTIDSIDINKI